MFGILFLKYSFAVKNAVDCTFFSIIQTSINLAARDQRWWFGMYFLFWSWILVIFRKLFGSIFVKNWRKNRFGLIDAVVVCVSFSNKSMKCRNVVLLHIWMKEGELVRSWKIFDFHSMKIERFHPPFKSFNFAFVVVEFGRAASSKSEIIILKFWIKNWWFTFENRRWTILCHVRSIQSQEIAKNMQQRRARRESLSSDSRFQFSGRKDQIRDQKCTCCGPLSATDLWRAFLLKEFASLTVLASFLSGYQKEDLKIRRFLTDSAPFWNLFFNLWW